MRKSGGDLKLIEAVSDHIQKHIGEVALVLHEKESPYVHVDVHIVKPSRQRPYYVVVSSGMSERPMPVPDDAPDCRFAEVMICLPPNWPLSPEAIEKEENWWPFRVLKDVARYPHVNKTWIFGGHSMSWSDPPESLAPNTRFSSVLLLKPKLIPEKAHVIQAGNDKNLYLWGIYPLYQEELEVKLLDGADRLQSLFQKNGITELLDPNRPSVVRPN